MQKLFLPYLTNDLGKTLDVENEVVVSRALPTSLEDSPEGWENNTVQYARNNEFKGLIKSFITGLKFFSDGAKILRDAFYRKGIETVLYFVWLKQNLSFGAGLVHEGWFKGEVAFESFKDVYDGVEVNIAEGGFFKQLQANKSVVYEMPFSMDEAVSLYHDGRELDQFTNYSILPTEDASSALVGFENLKTLPAIILTKEGLSGSVVTTDQDNEQTTLGDTTYIVQSSNKVAQNNGDIAVPVLIDGVIDFTGTTKVGTPEYSIYFKTLTSTYSVFSVLIPSVGVDYHYAFSTTITLQPGEKMDLFASWGVAFGESGVVLFKDTSLFKISFTSRFKPTVFNCFGAFDVGNYLVNKISDGQSSLTGTLLENDYNLLIASGDSIRGIPDAVLKTKLTDWHKSVDAVKCVALDIVNNNPVLKSRYDAFTDTTISALGECRNFSLEPAVDYMFNEYHFGYPNQESQNYDNLNGKYEVNTTQIYKAPVTRVKNTYDAISVYRADPSGIEALRINLEGKTTTDNKSDNDVFFIDAEPMYANYVGTITITTGPSILIINQTGLDLQYKTRFKILSGANVGYWTVLYAYETGGTTVIVPVEDIMTAEVASSEIVWLHFKLRRLVYTSITGIPNPDSIFNLELAPSRCRANHLRWIHSTLDHLEDKSLTFQTTDKNPNLVTVRAGVTIVETADIPISTMGAKVFLPYYLNFEVQSPQNLVDLMTANSSGHFDFLMGGVPLEGFPVDIKTSDSFLETQTYKVLCGADVDLTTLINNR